MDLRLEACLDGKAKSDMARPMADNSLKPASYFQPRSFVIPAKAGMTDEKVFIFLILNTK